MRELNFSVILTKNGAIDRTFNLIGSYDAGIGLLIFVKNCPLS